ncbi:MAG: PAS domain-containing protein [Salinivirgaceae bacterium]
MEPIGDRTGINFQNWQLFIDNVSDDIVIVDKNFYVILANKMARQSFNYPVVEPYRYTYLEFYHGILNTHKECPVKKAKTQKKTVTELFQTGNETSYRLTTKPVLGDNNQVEWIACVGRFVYTEGFDLSGIDRFTTGHSGEWEFELDENLRIVSTNRYMYLFTGIEREKLIDQKIYIRQLLASEFADIFTDHISKLKPDENYSEFRVLFKKVDNSYFGGYIKLYPKTLKGTAKYRASVRPFRNPEFGSKRYFEQIRLQNYLSIIADQMAQSESFEDGYRVIAKSVADVLDLNLCGFLHTKHAGDMQVEAALLNNRFIDEETIKDVKQEGIDEFVKSLEDNGLLHIPCVADAPYNYKRFLLQEKIHSFVAIPLKYRSRFVGAMVLGMKDVYSWPEYKLDFASTVGSIVLQSFIQEEMRERLRRVNESFINIFENSSDAVFIVALNGQMLEVNRTAETLTGYSKKELQQKVVSDISKTENLDLAQMPFEMFQSHQMVFGTELIPRTGESIPVETREKMIRFDDELAILVLARDVRHRRELNRLMVQTIASTEDKERKRIAEGLHDDVAPLLSTLRIYIDLLQNAELSADEIAEYSIKMKEIIGQSISTLRQVSRNLMPGVLTDFGLVEAITDFCNKLRQTGIIRINFDTDAKHYNLDNKITNIIYSVVKELINNTIKHADASEINLELRASDKGVKVSFTDNGIGVDIEKHVNSANEGLGLKNMLSKVNAVSGKVTALQNDGFGVEIFFPVKKETNIN